MLLDNHPKRNWWSWWCCWLLKLCCKAFFVILAGREGKAEVLASFGPGHKGIRHVCVLKSYVRRQWCWSSASSFRLEFLLLLPSFFFVEGVFCVWSNFNFWFFSETFLCSSKKAFCKTPWTKKSAEKKSESHQAYGDLCTSINKTDHNNEKTMTRRNRRKE